MCATVYEYVRHEHNIFDRESGRLPRRQHQDVATLGPGRSPQAGAYIDWAAQLFEGAARCLHEPFAASARTAVAYCRVSSAAQKPDLKNQRRVLEDFCAARGVAGTQFIEEVGGGLNLKRPKFVALMDRIEARQVSHLVIAHKDRLVRFGFQWFERFCAEHGTELLVLNNEQLSPEQEMVQDLLTIVQCFSARLYGLRNYRKKLKEALAEDLE